MKSGVFKLRQQWQDYSIKEYINGDEATTLAAFLSIAVNIEKFKQSCLSLLKKSM